MSKSTDKRTDKIEEIRERCAAASCSPWTLQDGNIKSVWGDNIGVCNFAGGDKKFILNAREDMLFLLDVVEELESERDELFSNFDDERDRLLSDFDELREAYAEAYGAEWIE
jgi:hypothetical protein